MARDKQQYELASRQTDFERLTAMGFSVFMIFLVLVPMLQHSRQQPRDCFPFSYFPMFNKRRADVVSVRHPIGIDAQGNQMTIPYRHLGRGGMNQMRKLINRKVREGQADELCRSLARKLGRRKRGALSSVETVAIVTSTYRLDEYCRGNKTPIAQQVEASCPVKRRKG